ncbi:MAG: hypothetical protein KAR39_01310 [Thermoplasmata archaeon]|nr:hypothetical protein [Thermoplasmata archaeon]
MVEAFMRDETKILKIEGPPGHTALLLDGEVVTTHPDGKKIFRMAKEMERSKEYEGREISVFWIPDTFPLCY